MSDRSVEIGEGTVFVGFCHRLDVKVRFMNSLMELFDHDRDGERRIVGRCALLSGPRIAEARSQICDAFMKHRYEKVDEDGNVTIAAPEWLLMLDDDMQFSPTLVEDMLRSADRVNVPVLGGLCFGGVHGSKVFPTIYRAFSDEDGHVCTEEVEEYQRNALIKVGATGAACLLINRWVLAAMLRPSNKPGEPFNPMEHGFGTLSNGKGAAYPWFVEGLVTSKGYALGEDHAFCRRLMMLGIPLYIDTSIKLGHCKEWVISEDDFDTYRREVERPGPMLDAALQVLKESGRFDALELDQIRRYMAARPSVLSQFDAPPPEPFVLPEPEPVG